jgi:CRISPR-associated endonuclease Csy4
MNAYIDIRLRSDPEFPATMLMSALYSKLHRALVSLKAENIGVSFPRHKVGVRARTLGELLRLHCSTDELSNLMTKPWLTGMRDHVIVADPAVVPTDAQYRRVCRRQFKTNAERLRRRRVRRHDETLEQARQTIPDSVEQQVELPFVQLASQSTGQRFSLFIEHGKIQKEPASGSFDSYGLSQDATVPWF